ncbi:MULTISPECIES: helicase associated domain-containing protein [Mycobacteroides]|uniref:Helicase-associated domain-containing protein n=2 Tax=Mycobacteroides TaxID=670516 RepID=A0A1X0IS35_9MYCO|nr:MULTISPECIES: helicase associated domain-containing protein [Mycobacteroides]MDO3312711.1 helicase associated domain-containing protein [Mycobacteroides abscessus subsp. abscessus]MDO3344607.1 helicase associated domain-containing protein [Mycobacteroides abscessus subsp. abscessus]ORB50700.1 hypothetical protein BST43_21375 [Mycobacteroides saopaulense]SHO97650.1 putative helicase [Mycobacteroides abscessus subsp. abscessus]SHP14565.1 putative helicase [Mycobacteroides abscessus subsp. abs
MTSTLYLESQPTELMANEMVDADPSVRQDARSEKFSREAVRYLLEYIAANGHAHIPRDYVCADGFQLGARSNNWRRRKISPEFIAKLDRVKLWRWTAEEARWDARFALLMAYIQEHGDARPPARWRSVDGFRLGGWVAHQRDLHRQGLLAPDRVRRLEACPGWLWEHRVNLRWAEACKRLCKFVDEHGTAAVPVSYIDSQGYKLGDWAAAQRKHYRAGALSCERIRQLESQPGWSWTPVTARSDEQWERGFKHLLWLVGQTGFADVPAEYRTPDGFWLGPWAYSQRSQQRDGTLDPERAARLNAMPGWTWHIEPSRQIVPQRSAKKKGAEAA